MTSPQIAAAAASTRTEAEVRASMDYRKIEQRNARLSNEARDAQQASGYCTYPRCKCIVQTSTTKLSPDCKLDLAYLPVEGGT